MVEKSRLLANRRANVAIKAFAFLFNLTPLGMQRKDLFTPDLLLEKSGIYPILDTRL
jgi:hypothetical protein